MARTFSQRRREMGEEAWSAYQTERSRAKAKRFYEANGAHQQVVDRQKKKRLLVEYKGGKCQRCELKTHIMDVYDFHHRDPETKLFGIAKANVSRPLAELKKEADKCDLLCRNCHAIVEYELRNV